MGLSQIVVVVFPFSYDVFLRMFFWVFFFFLEEKQKIGGKGIKRDGQTGVLRWPFKRPLSLSLFSVCNFAAILLSKSKYI